ncbi:FtsK/SpoIIIE domain-containing protein [Streptomyces sp. NPDC003300]|uniref:FtsK/SpoIIIE domain-containing protein n=1 Tax=unclassified Streptomyces TaxID=2593676 RepID=UPI0033B7018E
MKLTLTTVDAVGTTAGAVHRDHLLELPDGCTVGDLAEALGVRADGTPATAGRPGAPVADPARPDGPADPDAGPALHLGAAPLAPEAPIRDSGIREGSVLGVGGTPPDPDPLAGRVQPAPGEPVLAEVHSVSGPGAGRSWQLAQGSYEIGTDARCAIRVRGADAPEYGLWVTIAADGSAYWHRERAEDRIDGGSVRLCVPVPPSDVDPLTGTAPDRTTPEERMDAARAVDEAEKAARAARKAARKAARGPAADPRTVAARTPAQADTTARREADHRTAWPVDVDLAVGTTLLRMVAPVEADAAVADSADGIGVDFNRPPRIAPHLDAESLRLPSPPGQRVRVPFPLLMMFAPVVLGLVMVGIFHSYFYLVFILFTPLMAISNWVMGRRNNHKTHVESRRRYRARRRVVEREIRAAVVRERRVRCDTGPDPAALGLIATGPGSRLWERRRRDPDHLVLRVGTVDMPSVKAIEDPAQDENHRTVRWNLPDIPIGVEITELGVVGVAGTAAPVQALARWCVAQSAVLHSPRDLRIVVLTEPSRAQEWGWVRWLPHLRPYSPNGPVVAIGNDPESVANRVSELVSQIQARQRALGSSIGRAMFTAPDILVIADSARQLRDVPGMVQILTEGPPVRVFSLCLDEQERLLPEECGAVVTVSGTGLTVRRTGLPEVTGVRPDLVASAWCERVARALAPLRDVSPDNDSGLPDEVRLLDLLGQEPPDARALVDRWTRRPATTTFVLGTGYDGPMSLDLVRDGPHGLVAGTTGSGKSELLQSFVASLAAGNRPDELTFVLVDYKGGSAFRECANLPHTLGMVTDLDAHLVQRALDSLAAELRRRERILAEHDAKDHPEYRAKRAAAAASATDPQLPPLPRLLLVIDEFATLVREVPDFVTGLISIAQRGRSLGIHLILATQRPAGAVTADIKANTNLRIALRVTDMVESQDIIDTGDAVHISPSTPGRALVRYGHRSAVPFQSAWVGAERPAEESEDPDGRPRPALARPKVHAAELSWTRLGRPAAPPAGDDDTPQEQGPLAPTDLQVLVAALREAADLLDDYEPQPSPWLPALEPKVLLEELPAVERPGATGLKTLPPPFPYALEDIPQLQERRVATVDLATFGHLYVIGAPRSGRTQALRTIAGSAARTARLSDLHIYGIDAAGGGLAAVAALPHCGAVVSRHDFEHLERLLGRLVRELTERQEACSARSCSGLNELRDLLPEAERPAHILLLVDGWDALSPLIDDYDNGRLLGDITRLLREGAAAGIHVVATSERSLIAGRIAAHNDHKLLLRQADRSDYNLIGMLPSQVPASVPDGRGWHIVSRTETQIALLDADDSGQGQVEALRRIGAAATRRAVNVPDDRRPFPVAPLPAVADFSEVYEKVPANLRRPMWGLLGVGGDGAGAVGVDFAQGAPSFLVAGPPGSGRSNTLACLAVSLLAGGTSLVVLTPRESPLRALARHPQVRLLTEPDPSADAVREALDAMAGPRVVIVDDADLVAMGGAEKILKDIVVSGRERGIGLLAAGPADSLSLGLGSWLTAAKRSRRGLVLAPRNMSDGDLIGARLSISAVRSHARAGRAWTSGPGGTALTVQVPVTTLKTS